MCHFTLSAWPSPTPGGKDTILHKRPNWLPSEIISINRFTSRMHTSGDFRCQLLRGIGSMRESPLNPTIPSPITHYLVQMMQQILTMNSASPTTSITSKPKEQQWERGWHHCMRTCLWQNLRTTYLPGPLIGFTQDYGLLLRIWWWFIGWHLRHLETQ